MKNWLERHMKAIADQCGIKVKIQFNREVKLTSKLPPLVNSTHERADVLVYKEDDSKVVLLIEVHSSPMIYIKRKITPGAARFLHNSFSEFTSFVFQKLGAHNEMASL